MSALGAARLPPGALRWTAWVVLAGLALGLAEVDRQDGWDRLAPAVALPVATPPAHDRAALAAPQILLLRELVRGQQLDAARQLARSLGAHFGDTPALRSAVAELTRAERRALLLRQVADIQRSLHRPRTERVPVAGRSVTFAQLAEVSLQRLFAEADDETFKLLIGRCLHRSPRVTRAMIGILGRLGDSRAGSLLAQVAVDPRFDRWLRRDALDGLRRIGTPRIARQLVLGCLARNENEAYAVFLTLVDLLEAEAPATLNAFAEGTDAELAGRLRARLAGWRRRLAQAVRASIARGKPLSGLTSARRLQWLHPDDAEPRLLEARAWIAAKQPERAVELLLKVAGDAADALLVQAANELAWPALAPLMAGAQRARWDRLGPRLTHPEARNR